MMIVFMFSIVVFAQDEEVVSLNLTEEEVTEMREDIDVYSQIPEQQLYDEFTKDKNDFVYDSKDGSFYYKKYDGDGYNVKSNDGEKGILNIIENNKDSGVVYEFDSDKYEVTGAKYNFEAKYGDDKKKTDVYVGYEENFDFEFGSTTIDFDNNVVGKYDPVIYEEQYSYDGKIYYFDGVDFSSDDKFSIPKNEVPKEVTNKAKDYDKRKAFAEKQQDEAEKKVTKDTANKKLDELKQKEKSDAEKFKENIAIIEKYKFDSRQALSDYLGGDDYQDYKDDVDAFFANSFDYVSPGRWVDEICSAFLPPIDNGNSVAPVMTSPDGVKKPMGMLFGFKEKGYPAQCFSDQECKNDTKVDASYCKNNVCYRDDISGIEQVLYQNYYLLELGIRTPRRDYMAVPTDKFKFSLVLGKIQDRNEFDKEKINKIKYVDVQNTIFVAEVQQEKLGGLFNKVFDGYNGNEYDVACINILKGNPRISQPGNLNNQELKSICSPLGEFKSAEKIMQEQQEQDAELAEIDINEDSGFSPRGGI